LVAVELHEPPATTDTLGLALALALAVVFGAPAAEADDVLAPLLHAASSEMAAAPAAVAVIFRVLDNILARLLSSVLPCLPAVAAAVPARGSTPRKPPGPVVRLRRR